METHEERKRQAFDKQMKILLEPIDKYKDKDTFADELRARYEKEYWVQMLADHYEGRLKYAYSVIERLKKWHNILPCLLMSTSLFGGKCFSKEAVQKPQVAIQVSVLEHQHNTDLVRMQSLQKRVQGLSLYDLAYFKKAKNANYQDFGIQTEADLKWFLFLVDQRYQINKDFFNGSPPVVVIVGGPKEEEISQPGSIDG